MSQPQILTVAFCLCDGVTLSDFVPPSEILGGLNMADTPMFPAEFGHVPYRVKCDYLAPSMEPVKSLIGPAGITTNPTQTYSGAQKEGTQYDVLWVPAGMFRPLLLPRLSMNTLQAQAPKAKYILSVCGGSALLAQAGVLSGKRATTNKAFFKVIEAMSPKDITWVAKARWVVDGNVWTSSGVSAGSDMAIAFVAHLAGDKVARLIRGQVEVFEHGQDDDPFAEFHGLV
ncbi:transcriptional regulator [Flammula alnicola]|nr:transcriptional regulator [Flammula alnicola]